MYLTNGLLVLLPLTPRFGSELSNVSGVTGVRGEWGNNFNWDVSEGVGRNKAEFLIRNTVNASMGPDSLTFEPAEEVTLDAELAYTFGSQAEYSVIMGAENI